MNDSTHGSLAKARTIHFIGIGGIGISAIARMMLADGKQVSGSDREGSKVTEELAKLGATLFLDGQKAENVPAGCDLVVYTNALGADNPELSAARERKIPMMTYPQALHEISSQKFTIAVAGTHGKTTVTAMTAQILLDAKLDPTVIVGSLMKGIDSNFISGKGKYFVVEADEYKRSFHSLEPKILSINNLDEDHLDYYKDLADIQNAFGDLAARIPSDGFLVCNASDPHLAPVIARAKCAVLDYSKTDLGAWRLKVPGSHNRRNAQVAATIARALGVGLEIAGDSLARFEGAWRRFEYKGETESGAVVYDDYAHNPQKVEAALQGAREAFPGRHIIVVFQPHLYSRTKTLFNQFKVAFKNADHAILAPIYAAREPHDPSITSEMLCDAICVEGGKAVCLSDFASIEQHLKGFLQKGDVLITMGAGDVYKIGETIINK